MLTLEQIKILLKDRRVNIVSEATGIKPRTLRDIRDNENSNPTYSIFKPLHDYFNKLESVS